MPELIIGNKTLTQKDVWVCAEIGSNHMGDPDLCEKMIVEAARCGADAVKMQKRNNRAMFTKTAFNKPYDNDLSYGKTYGEHREKLDWFGYEEFKRFQKVADKHEVLFFATPFEIDSAIFLQKLGVPMFKIASCDVTNLPLIQYVARLQQPMLISTGGCSKEDLLLLKAALEPLNANFAPLHCISTYPNLDDQLNLRVLMDMRLIFPDKLIGFSSHHPGLLPIYLARFLGASIFEVHFTLNRGFRGTDHGFSMEPAGLAKICKDLKRIDTMLGNEEKHVLTEEKGGFIAKMGKSLYLKTPQRAGQIIRKSDILIKSPANNGLKPSEIGEIEGKILINDISTGICLRRDDFE